MGPEVSAVKQSHINQILLREITSLSAASRVVYFEFFFLQSGILKKCDTKVANNILHFS